MAHETPNQSSPAQPSSGEDQPSSRRKRFNKYRKPVAIAAIGFACVSGFAVTAKLTGCGRDVVIPESVAKREALQSYRQEYSKSTPIGKFFLQFITPKTGQEKAEDIGWQTDPQYEYQINNGCLRSSPYDPRQTPDIKGSYQGLFSDGHITGKIPTGQTELLENPNNSNELDVTPNDPKFPTLHLNGLNHFGLAAMDKTTQAVLNTYGCREGFVRFERHTP